MVSQYVAKAAVDETALLELYEKDSTADKKSAREVLEYLVPGANLDTVISNLKSKTSSNGNQPSIDVEDIKNSLRLEYKVEAMFDQLSDEERSIVKAEYDDLVDGKKLTVEKAKSYFDKAKKLALGDKKEEKKEKRDTSLYSTPTGGASATSEKDKQAKLDEARKLVNSLNILRR